VATCFTLNQSITRLLHDKISVIMHLNVKHIVFNFLDFGVLQELNLNSIILTYYCIIPVIFMLQRSDCGLTQCRNM
jgi:hypothetical protein